MTEAEAEVDILDRITDWPDHAKAELLSIAREIDADLKRGVYVATPAELTGIDAGLADIARGDVVGFEEIERLFEKYRTK